MSTIKEQSFLHHSLLVEKATARVRHFQKEQAVREKYPDRATRTMATNSSPQGKPPKSPCSKETPRPSPNAKKRKGEFDHIYDLNATTLSELVESRQYSTVNHIPAASLSTFGKDLFGVPLDERTNAERERRENAERNALHYQDRLRVVQMTEIYALCGSFAVAHRKTQVELDEAKVARADQQRQIDNLIDRVDSLTVAVTGHDNRIAVLEDKVSNLNATVATQRDEISFLRGLSPLCD